MMVVVTFFARGLRHLTSETCGHNPADKRGAQMNKKLRTNLTITGADRDSFTFMVGGATSQLKESSTLIAWSMENQRKAPSAMARLLIGSWGRCKLIFVMVADCIGGGHYSGQ